MKRKRFEKLLMGRHGLTPHEVRESIQNLIKLRRTAEQVSGNLFIHVTGTEKFGRAVIYSYKEMLGRYERGEPPIGIEEKAWKPNG